MNVFILCTGRSGSTTFINACQHITNYTAGHESRVHYLGRTRLDYPDWHIEADNRLSWMLGRLGKKYGKAAFYVHLRRDEEATAQSFDNRWSLRESIITAYAEGILMRPDKKDEEMCLDYVRTVNQNIDYFLRDKPNQMEIRLKTAKTDFKRFWKAIGAKGDLQAALAAWDEASNASKPPGLKARLRSLLRQI